MAYLQKNPAGTGPFWFVRWAKDGRIGREANEQYGRGAPQIKRLIFKSIPDDAVRFSSLQNGEADLAVNVSPHMANIIANHPKLFLSTAPSKRTIQFFYYPHQFDAQPKLVGPYAGLTADRRVRLAMDYTVNVEQVVAGVLDGKGIRGDTMLTQKHFGFDPGLKPIKQDLAQSKLLLTEAGFPNGVDMVLNSPQGRYVRDKKVAEVIVGQLTKAGIRTTLRLHEWGSYLNRRRLELYQRINQLLIDDAAAMLLYQQVDLYGATKRMNWKARGDERIKGFDMANRDSR